MCPCSKSWMWFFSQSSGHGQTANLMHRALLFHVGKKDCVSVTVVPYDVHYKFTSLQV